MPSPYWPMQILYSTYNKVSLPENAFTIKFKWGEKYALSPGHLLYKKKYLLVPSHDKVFTAKRKDPGAYWLKCDST